MSPKCDICGAFLTVHSDAPCGYGRLTFTHEGPCIPKPVRYFRQCTVCAREMAYEVEPDYHIQLFLCGDRCRKAHQEERRLAQLAHGRAYQAKLRRDRRVA